MFIRFIVFVCVVFLFIFYLLLYFTFHIQSFQRVFTYQIFLFLIKKKFVKLGLVLALRSYFAFFQIFYDIICVQED